MTTNMSHLLKGLSLSLVVSGSKPGYAWVVSHFAPGLRTCFVSFASPWRSSRLSSSLPQSSQRTAAKNAKPNHAPIETEPLLTPDLTTTERNVRLRNGLTSWHQYGIDRMALLCVSRRLMSAFRLRRSVWFVDA